VSTISGTTITTGVVLSNSGSYTSPLTITGSGAVETSSGNAIYGFGYQAWTVANYGTVMATGSLNSVGDGILLRGGGSLDNAGLIAGGGGVYITGSTGTASNSGTINGTASRGWGIQFYAGGSIANNAGLIEGYRGGIDITGSAGTVTNSGTIIGTRFFGVELHAGGSVDNTTGGLIQGANGVGGDIGSVTNSGTIMGTRGIVLGFGGSVSNTTGSLIEGGYTGVYIAGAAGTVTNSGTILGTSSNGVQGSGVHLSAGGSVSNISLIEGGAGAVEILGSAGVVTNSGTITSTYSTGVALGFGGSVSNTSGGLIQGGNGGDGVVLHRGINGNPQPTSTLINAGTILATGGLGVLLSADGSGVNNSGLIKGRIGVYIYGTAGTVTNTGTILGTAGHGVRFGNGSGTLTNFGTVTGDVGIYVEFFNAHDNTIVNYSTITGTSGTAISLGTAGHDRIVIEAGSSLQGVIASLQPGDSFDLSFMSFSDSGIATIVSNGTVSQQLQIVENGSTFTIALDPNQDFSGDVFHLGTDSGSGTLITEAACFCRGTLIRTATGEMPVEELRIGDTVVTLSGKARPIRWIGWRAYDGRFIAGNRNVLPIRIEAGAISDGVPLRDLWLSPEHSLCIDGVLVQAKHIVNGATIVQADSVERVEYFHIELATHDVLFADGAPAESFADCDNRLMFANGADYAQLYPEDERPRWQFCAKRLVWGSLELTAIRAALLERAAAIGHALESDPDLHLLADGVVVRPDSVAGCRYRFTMPAARAGFGVVES